MDKLTYAYSADYVTEETHFDQRSVSLLSAISTDVTGETIDDKRKFRALIKANQALCNAELSQHSIIEGMKSDWKLYRPLVVVGPSGVGKGTLISKLTARYPESFGFSVSYTTRGPRAGELDGREYFFVNHEEFEKKISNDAFIEYCKVHANFYGTEKAQISQMSERKIIPILDIDIQGAKKMYAAFPETNFIFICPPSIGAQRQRLDLRATDSAEQREIRLKNASGEI